MKSSVNVNMYLSRCIDGGKKKYSAVCSGSGSTHNQQPPDHIGWSRHTLGSALGLITHPWIATGGCYMICLSCCSC